MPAAALIGGLVVIAFAFAAISAVLLVRQLIVSPIRGAAAAVSEVAIVGGVVAWALTQLAIIIEIGLGGMDFLAEQAKRQAADAWNYIVHETVAHQFFVYFNEANIFNGMLPALLYVVQHFSALYELVVHSVWPTTLATSDGLQRLQGFVYGEESQTINAINQDLVGLHHWIDGYELPLIRGIGNDLAGLRDWVGSNAASHSEVIQAEAKAVAQASAIAAPLAIAIEGIRDSPCMKVCEPLGNLGSLIQGLEDASLLAILLALIAETKHDPAAVQAALREVVRPAVDDIVSSIGLTR